MPNYPKEFVISLSTSSCFLFAVCFSILSCQSVEQDIREVVSQPVSPQTETVREAQVAGTSLSDSTIELRFTPPPGFIREPLPTGSFGHYLRSFPLHPEGRKVHLYNGQLKSRQDVHAAVLDIDVGQRDLQQCADAVMRLRAEYLRQQGRDEEIHFNFTNGFKAEYARWQRGERIKVNGNRVNWVAAGRGNADPAKAWKAYLTMVFSYAGTLSLAKELEPVLIEDLAVGNVFIRGGSPGHAVIVVDKCVHPQTGEVAYLLAQSYMPAQEIHVLINPLAPDHSPWYFVSQSKNRLMTPEWSFQPEELSRFPQAGR